MDVCEKCHSKYVPGIGYGPQNYCDYCSHQLVAALQAENEKLKKENARLHKDNLAILTTEEKLKGDIDKLRDLCLLD